LTGAEYAATEAPYANGQYWLEKKADMDAALALPEFQSVEVILASYGYGNYCGDAFVLFRKGGKLYEVNAGHCSCYGLEGQWSPEETTVESLWHRLTEGRLGSDNYTDNVFANDLRDILQEMVTA
jgi:hypothetical protein